MDQKFGISMYKQLRFNNRMNTEKFKVTCFGAGFVGLPTTSVLALKNPGVEFVIFDIDERRIQSVLQGKMPIFEPGLEETAAQVIGKNMTLTTNISLGLDNASVVMLALPTPTKTSGQNAGKAYDLSYTEKGLVSILNYYNQNPQKMQNKVIIIEKSTVPIGTAKMISKIISSVSNPELKERYIVVSNPQFLAEGTAVNDLMKPDRVILGVRDQKADISKVDQLYSYAADRIIHTHASSAQLSKLVANCFLAQRVSSINSIAIFCEQYDADVKQVKKCIATDTRIGDKFLQSSVGFGGSCFKKDMLALIYLAQCKGLHEVARYWNAVIEMNNYRKKKFFQRVFYELNSNLKGKKLAILGTAFKKGTCDARESPAIDICKDLLIEGAILQIYDPKTTRNSFISEMKYNEVYSDIFEDRIVQKTSVQQAINDSHAILILTEWDQFKTLPYSTYLSKMHKPAYIFDGRNILQQQKMKNLGFCYVRIGKKFIPNEH